MSLVSHVDVECIRYYSKEHKGVVLKIWTIPGISIHLLWVFSIADYFVKYTIAVLLVHALGCHFNIQDFAITN